MHICIKCIYVSHELYVLSALNVCIACIVFNILHLLNKTYYICPNHHTHTALCTHTFQNYHAIAGKGHVALIFSYHPRLQLLSVVHGYYGFSIAISDVLLHTLYDHDRGDAPVVAIDVTLEQLGYVVVARLTEMMVMIIIVTNLI